MPTTRFNFNLAGYHLREEICRNSKTIVFRGHQIDESSGATIRNVAIKMLTATYPSDRDLISFRHQYTLGKQLDCPQIVRVYELIEGERGYALVMADGGGVSLAEYRQDRCLSVLEVLKIAIQLADALQAIGQRQIVHKDIKPWSLD